MDSIGKQKKSIKGNKERWSSERYCVPIKKKIYIPNVLIKEAGVCYNFFQKMRLKLIKKICLTKLTLMEKIILGFMRLLIWKNMVHFKTC